MLKKCKYRGTLKTVKSVIDHNFGGYSKARDKFYFPLLAEMHKLGFKRLDIGKIFVDDYLLPYLSLINDYFRQGYNIKKIASLTSLEFLIFDSYDIIKQVVFALYSDYYVEGMTFNDLRNKVFRDIFMEHIKLGVKDYTTLRSVLKGLDRPKYGNNIIMRNNYIANFFRRCFNGKGINKVFIEIFPTPETSKLHRKAIDLIRINKKDIRYSAGQLCIDLGFESLYKVSIATLKHIGGFYIQSKIGVTFENLKLEAFGLTDKNYLGMALNLLRDHIDLLGASRHSYNMGKLAIDLGLAQDFGYSVSYIRNKASILLKRYTGHSWQKLILMARTNVLTK